MKETYIHDKEYKNYYFKMNGLRKRIAKEIPIKKNYKILEVATGDGVFAVELAKLYKSASIVAIDISDKFCKEAKNYANKQGVRTQINVKKMDATNLTFPAESFDIAVNFMGLEEIYMTRGKQGITKVFKEAYRVLKPGRYFCFTLMPPEEMETKAQKTEVAIFSYICNSTWLSKKEYMSFLRAVGFKLSKTKVFRTGKKLSPSQAKQEVRFACKETAEIFNMKTRSFEEVWKKFGGNIEKHGLGLHSKTLLVIAQKR